MATKTRNGKRKADSPLPRRSGNDDESEATAKATNKDDIVHPCCSYLLLRVEVSEAKKGTELMRSSFAKIFSILQDADDTVALTVFKSEPSTDDDGNYLTSSATILTAPENFPSSITALNKYFFGARPQSNGGVIWCQVRLVHTEPVENIIADTKEDLQNLSSNLTLQTIQHWDVAQLGFFKNLHPEVDLKCLTEFFTAGLQRVQRQGPISIGLKVKTPYDGKKVPSGAKKTPYKDRIHAVHLEVRGDQAEVARSGIKTLLSQPAFQRRYSMSVRLVPLYDRREGPHTQDKIRRCIVQHGQFCRCVDYMACSGIEHLDQKNTKLRKTLRELIVGLPEAHFINIDLNWKGDALHILYPKKYEDKSRELIANLGPYLHKFYGDDILTSLPADTQELISQTKWDDQGRPISKLDQELDDILAVDESIDFIDIQFLKETTPTKSSPAIISSKFIPKIDDESVSTFRASPDAKAVDPMDVEDDDRSMVSAITLDSRMSNMEQQFGRMETLLQQIVKNHNADSRNASSSVGRSKGADPSKSGSAHRV